MELRKTIETLEHFFSEQSGTLTAFSGGVDSALVLFLSRQFLGKKRAIGVISKAESLKSTDYRLAVEFASKHDIDLVTIKTNELSDANYAQNPVNRCYFCKSHLYNSLEIVMKDYPGFVTLNGTNMDDLGDYRPGLSAATEHQVKSPLKEAGLDKKGVRELAKHFGLDVWDKPASPCMSSRIPYGQEVTRRKLLQIEKAEALLYDLGFPESRVRHLGSDCSIEVPVDELDRLAPQVPRLQTEMRKIGFATCSIDHEGLVSGKLNRQHING